MLLMLVFDRNRGLTAPTTMNSATIERQDHEFLAIADEEAPKRATCRPGPWQRAVLKPPPRPAAAWVMAAPTASGVASPSAKLGDDPAAIHHQHPVAHAEHFRQFARDHQDGHAFASKLAHQLMDFRLGADIDAARRLVHDEDARIGREPFAQAPPSADCRPTARERSAAGPRALMPNRSIAWRADRQKLARRSMNRPRVSFLRMASATFSAIVCVRIRPWVPRSSGI